MSHKRIFQGIISLGVAGLILVIGIVLAVLSRGMFAEEKGGSQSSQTGTASSEATVEERDAVPVIVQSARTMVFEQRIDIAGNILAKRFALVSARIPGTLDAIFVDEGDFVEAGKTKLFQTDSVKLTQAVAIAQEQVTVAECAVREKEALLDKTLVGQQVAEADLARYKDLAQRNAVARQVLEHQEAQVRQFEADVRHVRTLIELAKAQLEQARLNLKVAEKDLADSLVVAPISGRVSLRMKEPGEMAGTGTPVLRIDDLSLVEVSIFVPSEYYDQVVIGQTKLRVRVGERDLGELPVTFKSPVVEPRLRTFQVKALLQSPPPEVVPGSLAMVSLVLASRQGLGVPVQAIQQRGGKNMVFVVTENKAKAIPVELGWETEGWQEIRSGLSAVVPVITSGQSLVDDGTPVHVVKEAGR
jgi:RND family efflux transporter MFP subunit